MSTESATSSVADVNNSAVAGVNFTIFNTLRSDPIAIRILVCATYCAIFLLAVVGNMLVIITLVLSRRMRTVMNVLLLNLAVSDLIMAVTCIPPQLTAFLARRFIFGTFFCPLHRYLQGVCIAVSVYTLLVLSLERFFAIVAPLWARRWQTLSHAYRMIIIVWIFSYILMSPLAAVNRTEWLKGIQVHKCDESWPSVALQLAYSFLQLVLVYLLPLVGMCISYLCIAVTLRRRKTRHISPYGEDLLTNDKVDLC